jgi:Eukaryotic membrane protein family
VMLELVFYLAGRLVCRAMILFRRACICCSAINSYTPYEFVDHFWDLVPDIVLVMLAELVVDYVKHAFITKFNELQPEVIFSVICICNLLVITCIICKPVNGQTSVF